MIAYAYPVFGLIYVVLAIIICVYSLSVTNGNTGEFMRLAGVYLAFLTSLLTAIFVALNACIQIKAAAKLEELKNDLNRKLERDKIRASAVDKAIEEVIGCMNKFYFALAELENGIFDRSKISEAENDMKTAYGLVHRLHKDCISAFEDYFQKGVYVKQTSETMTQTDARRDFWEKQIHIFNDLFGTFVARCRVYHDWA